MLSSPKAHRPDPSYVTLHRVFYFPDVDHWTATVKIN
jgi:hypothetical protein